jgi:hypothetical protein
MACRLGQQFSFYADIFLPFLMKQVTVKILIMSQSADKAIRIILASTKVGYPKCMNILIDQASSKNPVLRRLCFEYLTLTCACWRNECLDK